MQVLHHQKKGAHLNTIERFHIHIEHAAGNHLSDEYAIFPNKIFDILIKLNASHTLQKLSNPSPLTLNNTFRMHWPVSDETTYLQQDSVFFVRQST